MTGGPAALVSNAVATTVSVSTAYTSARSATKMSQADGLVQSISCREMSTVPPYVSLLNGIGVMVILRDGSSVFSPLACRPSRVGTRRAG